MFSFSLGPGPYRARAIQHLAVSKLSYINDYAPIYERLHVWSNFLIVLESGGVRTHRDCIKKEFDYQRRHFFFDDSESESAEPARWWRSFLTSLL